MIAYNEWHQVENKLPYTNGTFLTYGYETASSNYCQAYFSRDENFNPRWQELDECGDFFDYPPTHWIELPYPPKD